MLLLNQDPGAISQLFLVLGEGYFIRLPLHNILSLTTITASRVLFFNVLMSLGLKSVSPHLIVDQVS